MKKIYIIGIIVLLLVSTTIASVMYSNKTDAQTEFSTYKTIRENNIDNIITTVDYGSDKECWLNYTTGEPEGCEVCIQYEFNYGGDRYNEVECISLNPDTTLEQDETVITNRVREIVEEVVPKDKYRYTERVMIGGSLSVS